jgi:hypothetical protein
MWSPPAETPAVWLGDARGGLHIDLACAKLRRLWRLFGPEAFFCSV